MEKRFSAVALGIFDGVHLGHRSVLESVSEQEKNGLMPSVFTFEPEIVLRKSGGAAGYIYDMRTKTNLLGECGIENINCPPFDDIKNLSGGEFAENILVKKLNASFVCCGKNFRFGKNASCGVEELKKFGMKYNFEVKTVSEVKINNQTVSSSLIRKLLLDGDITNANKFLGRNYSLTGETVHGNHIGRTLNFPTVNQNYLRGQLVPEFGSYRTRVNIDGVIYNAVTNVGVKPTVKGERNPLAETHILDFSGDLYGKTITVEFLEFIRPEMKFSSLDELKSQIEKDISCVRYN